MNLLEILGIGRVTKGIKHVATKSKGTPKYVETCSKPYQHYKDVEN